MPAKKSTKSTEPALDINAILALSTQHYLSEDEKEEMSDDRTPFTISKIESTTDKKYGKRWELTITVDGQSRGLTIPSHEARDKMITALAQYVDANGTTPPMRLKVKPFGEGRTWISILAAKGAR